MREWIRKKRKVKKKEKNRKMMKKKMKIMQVTYLFAEVKK
jgi:hypothetical protein